MLKKRLTPSLALTGMKKGGRVGFYLALIYNLLFPVIWFYTDPSRSIAEPGLASLFTSMIVMPFYGLFIGCLPATILGGITGWLVGKVFDLLGKQLKLFRGLVIGAGMTVSIALLMNWFVIFDTPQPSHWLWNWSYLVLLGIPTSIYIVASPVVCYILYKEIKT